MSDREDVLKRAASALSGQGEPDAAELARLRARVLAGQVVSLDARKRAAQSKVKRLRWLLPLAAAFVAGSALAATPGAWEGLRDALERYLHVSLQPAEKHAAAKTATRPQVRKEPSVVVQPTPALGDTPAPAIEAAPSDPVAPVLLPVAPPSEPTRPARRTRRAHPSAPQPAQEPATQLVASPSVVAPPSPTPAPAPRAPSEELARFREAHALQFRARVPAAALSAWDDYLTHAPQGTLAVEARYNRALCLVELKRYDDARKALDAFARGAEASGYKRTEAIRILKALEKQP